jgi:uncharacterized protein YbjT (DUF2867 family)
MILVVGSTGLVGREVVRRLAAKGKPVRALVRTTSDPAKVAELKAHGAEIVVGDLRDRASLDAACRGATAVISTASAMPFSYVPEQNTPQSVDRDGVLDLVAAAEAAGVQHFVYVSFPAGEAASSLQDAKRAVEQRLCSGRLTYTILHPSFFMEVWLSPAVGFDYGNRTAQLYGTGLNPISWISFQDVASAAVESLKVPAARNALLGLGGPQALSPAEVVQVFEQVSGQPFQVQYVPVEALQAQHAAATDEMQKTFAALMIGYAKTKAIDTSQAVQPFGLQLRSVQEYARQVLGKA